MTRVTIHTAKTHLSRLLARVAAGEEILIVNGQDREPVALLVHPRRGKRKVPKAGWLKGQVQYADADESVWAPMTRAEAEAEGWE